MTIHIWLGGASIEDATAQQTDSLADAVLEVMQ